MPKKQTQLQKHLVLNSYICSLFGRKDFKEFQSILEGAEDGFDEEGRSYVLQILLALKDVNIPKDKLEEYDANIKGYLDHINRRREAPIEFKYFQYMSLLFTEAFLDKYFENPKKLLTELNDHVVKTVPKDQLGLFAFSRRDLRKLAFWMATGSGKTLIMHINFLQFMRYNQGPHEMEMDNILLITPNESLSKQHIEEMKESDVPCELFIKNGGGYFSSISGQNYIKVLDIHKLTEEKKGEGVTFDIEDFGRRNLIFVDEGHKGSGGFKWRRFREFVAEEGFTFEYSATFGQAVATAGGDTKDLLMEYGKAVIFDYSYRYFYMDGHGKEYRILNLRKDLYQESSDMLMLANLLSFYEQKLLFEDYKGEADEYNIEDPLWIFVGSKVTGVSTVTIKGKKEETSDLLRIVVFLSKVLQDKGWAVKGIRKILAGKSGLLDSKNRDLFSPQYPEKKLTYIKDIELQPEQIYGDLLKRVFHADSPSPLYLVNLKSAGGEIALKAGMSEFFGVINIGDDAKFMKLVGEKTGIPHAEDQMTPSLFDAIKEPGSNINLLIGAKKFIEGWDCWRVSNMGLLNIGKKEGHQIIQLFGRGVRLKGKGRSLKRSRPEDHPPKYLKILETLNIFGIEANYMDLFAQLLKAEGIQTENYVEVPLPLDKNTAYLKKGLLIPKVDIERFRNEEFFPLEAGKVTASVNLIPMVDIISSLEKEGLKATTANPKRKIETEYYSLLDWDRIYFSMLEYKQEKGWNNIVISKEVLQNVITKGLYSLYCSEDVVKPRKFADVWHLEEAVISVLKKFLQSFYGKQRNTWATKNMEIVKLTEKDANIDFEYSIKVSEKEALVLSEVQDIVNKKLEKIYKGEDISNYLKNVHFDRHLYQPLLEDSADVQISPAGLNEYEQQFVEDLRDYFAANSGLLKSREVFIIRNLPRIGTGFYMESNFYPDFIIWVKSKDKQHLIFADPHGLGHAWRGREDDKVRWYSEIKEIEKAVIKKSGVDIKLDSYIISVTPHREIKGFFNSRHPSDLKECHVLFQEDRGSYIEDLLSKALNT